MSVRRISLDVLAGAANSAVALIAALVAMPLYLRFLGSEAFGVLGFALALQTIVLALDAGLGIGATRTVADAQATGRLGSIGPLLNAIARAAWWVGFGGALALALLAPLLAAGWLRLERMPAAHAAQALALTALLIGLRWPIAFFQGVLLGARETVAASAIHAVGTLVATVAAILAAALTSDLRAVVAALCVVSAAQAAVFARRSAAVHGATQRVPAASAVAYFRACAAAGGLGLVGVAVTQIDKVLLSTLVPASEFGYYMLASLMAGSLYPLVGAVFNVLYPHLAKVAHGSRDDLEASYRSGTLALTAFVFPVAAALAMFGDSILLAWTRDPVAAAAGGPVVRLLALGAGLHAIMYAPYALKLARGATTLALRISLSMLALALPLILFCAMRWGAVGAAAAWLAQHAIYLAAGATWTHARLMPGVTPRWFAQDVAPPVLVSLAIILALQAFADAASLHALARTLLAGVSVLLAWLVLVLGSRRLRAAAAGIRNSRKETAYHAKPAA
ncbi:lipopolysaccharide biosynthesis protein [Ramlibacter sp.]|uniref:lipopolysaccharide biosynthesis protein n=1 Tax=Ramlibacter sp. TaxID=1917967 RepID=UPI003D0BB1CA